MDQILWVTILWGYFPNRQPNRPHFYRQSPVCVYRWYCALRIRKWMGLSRGYPLKPWRFLLVAQLWHCCQSNPQIRHPQGLHLIWNPKAPQSSWPYYPFGSSGWAPLLALTLWRYWPCLCSCLLYEDKWLVNRHKKYAKMGCGIIVCRFLNSKNRHRWRL